MSVHNKWGRRYLETIKITQDIRANDAARGEVTCPGCGKAARTRVYNRITKNWEYKHTTFEKSERGRYAKTVWCKVAV